MLLTLLSRNEERGSKNARSNGDTSNMKIPESTIHRAKRVPPARFHFFKPTSINQAIFSRRRSCHTPKGSVTRAVNLLRGYKPPEQCGLGDSRTLEEWMDEEERMTPLQTRPQAAYRLQTAADVVAYDRIATPVGSVMTF
ncbi:hypothetical protein NDU88_009908 [Pleurodeles waltl]|uniref:Uncharacterized protein n=1 Tax=Pleurodeles waltl TaxID=8319 RepID=A0AAV7RZ22_PLEWA|nr:hypothetical protein NDU88_009908 [Pleurodeles waltl]